MTKSNTENIELYCVRAEFGTYTKQFIEGNYVAIGWLPKNGTKQPGMSFTPFG